MTITGRCASRTISSVSSIDWCLTAIRYGPGGICPRPGRGCRAHARASQWCSSTQLSTTASVGRRPNRLATMPASTHSDRRRIEDRRVEQRPQQRHQMSAHTARRRSRYLLYSPNRVRKLGSVRTASVDQPISAPEHFLEFVARAAHVPVAGDQPERAGTDASRASVRPLRRWSACRPIRCRDRRSMRATCRLPGMRRARSGLGHRRDRHRRPAAACALPWRSTSIACSIRPWPPVSTTAASVAARIAGAGLPSVKANSTKPSA